MVQEQKPRDHNHDFKVIDGSDTTNPTGAPKFSPMEIYATFVAAFAFLCIGLLRAYTSPAINSMKENPEIFNTTSAPQKEVISWIASSPPMASFIGTVISGPLLQYCGRQATIFILSLPYVLGWLSLGFAQNILMVMAGRILTGLAAGIATAAAQLYVSECVRPEVRGTLGFLPSMMLALGVLLGFAASTINVEWRELALIMGSLPMALLIMSLTIPESPPWLIMRGKMTKATNNLQSFRGSSVPRAEIEDEIEQLKEAVYKEKKKRRSSKASILSNISGRGGLGNAIRSFWTAVKKREIYYPAFIAIGLMMFQQFSAANVVIYFLSVILKDAEPVLKIWNNNISTNASDFQEFQLQTFSVLDHNVGSVIVGVVQFLAFFLSLPLIDRMGRKILLIISANLMALSLGVLGLYFYANDVLHQSQDDSSSGSNFEAIVTHTYFWLPLTCLSVFIASYSIGFGPVPFIIMSEVFPSKARSYLCSLTSFFNHFFLFVVIKMFPMMVDSIGSHWTFWVFATSCLISIFFVIFVVPETKGKTLAEIERGFANPKEVTPLLDRRDSYAVGLP